MKNTILSILMLLVLSACGPDSIFSLGPPFMRHLPDGNDSFSIGFRDGCNTYMGIIGTGPLQLKTYQVDNMRALEDDQYNKGFNNGRNYCTYYLDAAVN